MLSKITLGDAYYKVQGLDILAEIVSVGCTLYTMIEIRGLCIRPRLFIAFRRKSSVFLAFFISSFSFILDF